MRAVLALLGCLLSGSALAQSSPGLTYGQVPTAGQWNGYFASKMDVLPYRPLNPAGGTLTGRLVTAPSTINAAGFNIPFGIAPSAPVSGDIWTTSLGLFAQIGASTVGPFASQANLGTMAQQNATGVAITGGAINGTAIGASNPSTLRGTLLGLTKLSAAPTAAPGAGSGQIFMVAGTNAGSCKLQIQAGTSTTPVTIVDNVGSGC